MTTEQILYTLLFGLSTAFLTFLFRKSGDRTKTGEDELARVIKDMEQLKVTAVSEGRVREIIKDAIEPTSSDVKEIKNSMHEFGKTLHDIQLKLATELAYKRGRQDKEEK